MHEAVLQVRNLSTLPRFGDGRLAPHEWIRTSDGCVLKTDNAGRRTDHTIIGQQTILWDVAGAVVEWHLDDSGRQLLVEVLQRLGARVDLCALHFHELAYASFRLGQVTLCSDLEAENSTERPRLAAAATLHRRQLLRLLDKRPVNRCCSIRSAVE